MSNAMLYCAVTSEKLVFLSSFADVIEFFEKKSKTSEDIIELYKWQAKGGYAYYLTISK